MATHPERISFNVKEALAATGLNRNALYKAIANGELSSFKVGRRRMLSARALHDFVEKKERDARGAGAA